MNELISSVVQGVKMKRIESSREVSDQFDHQLKRRKIEKTELQLGLVVISWDEDLYKTLVS